MIFVEIIFNWTDTHTHTHTQGGIFKILQAIILERSAIRERAENLTRNSKKSQTRRNRQILFDCRDYRE